MNLKIIFLKKNDSIGNLVKRVSNGTYSHVAFMINDGLVFDTDFIRNFGVRVLPWNKEDFDIINLTIKEVQYQELLDSLYLKINTKYDNWENWRFVLKKLFKIKDNTNKLNCVESVIDTLVDIGILSPVYKSEILSPTEVYNILKSRENSF